MIRGLPRDPLLAAIMQAVEQQKLQEQQKAQVMQTLGFGGNMSQFGAIPQGHGITNMEGKVWTRPGGTPPGIQMLLEKLMGAESKPAARFTGFDEKSLPPLQLKTQANTPLRQPDLSTPVSTQPNLSEPTADSLRTAKEMHSKARTLADIEQLYRLYPQEMEYLLGGGR